MTPDEFDSKMQVLLSNKGILVSSMFDAFTLTTESRYKAHRAAVIVHIDTKLSTIVGSTISMADALQMLFDEVEDKINGI